MNHISSQRILITAALPYANGPIHLGHLAGAYLPADIYARYQRLQGRETLFICGSDEHGVPITITAEKEGTTPQKIVDYYHAINAKSFEQFEMSFDNYSRTSLPLHHETALEFFLDFQKRGILKEKAERQFYDEKAQMFLPDRYVEGTCPVCSNPEARGDQCEKCGSYLSPSELISPKSKITGETPVVKETTHWYFPLGQYQSRLESYVQERNARDGWRETVLKYCESWFRDGLQDRAVTRDLNWGVRIPLKGYENKVLYVWFDAVLGYISSTKEWAKKKESPERWRDFWQDAGTKYVAFIGKDNIVFHCIVFPSMLMAWNDAHERQYVLPENVPANEFLNFEGQKFSKSRGWGIDVKDFLELFPNADALRYSLATILPETKDADFYLKDYQAKNNNELADILGNFVNRTLQFAGKNFGGRVPERGPLNERDTAMIKTLTMITQEAGALFEQYHFRDGVQRVMDMARLANKYFNDSEPWKTLKSEPTACATTINICIHTVRSLALLFAPVIPAAAAVLWHILNLPGTLAEIGWNGAKELAIPAGHPLGTPSILFTKIEDKMIDDVLKRFQEEPKAETVTITPIKPTISIDELNKVDLRTAKIISCEKVPKSNKLLKLRVQLGSDQRQLIAGIAQYYTAEQLVGKTVIIVANLQPAKLMGEESQGMVLATESNGKLLLLGVDGDVESGSVIK
ncbi:MAG: methionine--tRNA ligase [Bacteroidota bacterium]